MTRHILIIEDDPSIAQTIKLGIELIEGLTISLETIGDGQIGLERVQAQPAPDMIVLDMHLPRVNGQVIYETARQKIPACNILIVTADTALIEAITHKLGMWGEYTHPDAVFTKPFSLLALQSRIAELL